MGIAAVRRLALGALVAVVAALGVLPVATTLAATNDFPSGYEAYHTYAETIAVLDSEVAAHPSIVRKFSIGTSYQGRPIWAAKISDNVGVDENEPEVVFTSLTHAREHITTEMALYILHLLVDNYGTDTHITRLVNTREIFIVFEVNPDGGEYDISNGKFHYWRKNRQPTPNSTQIGTDNNRNFGFKWGCCGGSSGDPSKETYRGPFAWSAPETVVYRNFIRSRVIGGVQQIKILVDWHSSGKLVLWPYSYTTVNVADGMTSVDHSTFVALARHSASLNGYTAQQSSDLYISDGTQGDWAYHEQHIFELTFEMGPGGGVNFYPTPDKIAHLTSVNRSAVLYLLDLADCPYRAAGLQSQCGTIATPLMYQTTWIRQGPISL
jgi:carboxypeptidase T